MAVVNPDTVIHELKDYGLDAGQMPSGDQLGLVSRFATLYEKHGLIVDGQTPALRNCCANGDACWQAAGDRRPNRNKGGIALPWVGPQYEPGGVLVLGMNFNDAHGLGMAFELSHWEEQAFARGESTMHYDMPGYRGSNFAYRSTRSAGLLVDRVDEVPITDREEPKALGCILNRVVRLQTVKCSPRNKKWSAPTDMMWERCPPMLLRDEALIAKPGFVIGFGADVRWALAQLAEFTAGPKAPRLHTGSLICDGLAAEVFMLDHPRAVAYWPSSHESLAAFLRRSP